MSHRALLLLTVAALLPAGGCGRAPATPPPTVAQVDLDRYVGTWYEVARIPNRFQQQCVADTTAQYARRADGMIEVVNRCRTDDGRYDEARGVARVVDTGSNARLEVSFFELFGWRPVWGDYWVLELAPNYEYALVGTPDRRYGWLLARSPTLPDATRTRLDARMRDLGYDPAQFVTRSPQSPAR